MNFQDRDYLIRIGRPLVVAMALALTACGSKVVFEGQSGIPISGEVKAKPKLISRPKLGRVVLHEKNIEITEKVQFELNKATILPESFGLLDEVSGVIKDHKEIKKVAIEGHASSDGNPQQNLQLSDARAKSVMEYIATKGGIDRTRLTAEGFGDKRPIADNNTEEGRVKNRRVEFNIVEKAGDKPAANTPATTTTPAPKK